MQHSLFPHFSQSHSSHEFKSTQPVDLQQLFRVLDKQLRFVLFVFVYFFVRSDINETKKKSSRTIGDACEAIVFFEHMLNLVAGYNIAESTAATIDNNNGSSSNGLVADSQELFLQSAPTECDDVWLGGVVVVATTTTISKQQTGGNRFFFFFFFVNIKITFLKTILFLKMVAKEERLQINRTLRRQVHQLTLPATVILHHSTRIRKSQSISYS